MAQMCSQWAGAQIDDSAKNPCRLGGTTILSKTHTHYGETNTQKHRIRNVFADQSVLHTHAHAHYDTTYFRSNNLFLQIDIVITIKGVNEKITIRFSFQEGDRSVKQWVK